MIDFTTNPGGYFPRIGRLLHLGYLASVYEATLPAAFTSFQAQFLASLQAVIAPTPVAQPTLIAAASGVMSIAGDTAVAISQQTVLADQPSQSVQFLPVMQEIIRQMKAQSLTVQVCTVGSSQSTLSGTVGTGILVMTTVRGDGLVQENTIPEVLRLVCTADSYTGGTTAGQETFGLTGAPSTAGIWDYNWPTGSGASVQISAISADQGPAANSNLLTNSNFELWTAGPPDTLDSWTLQAGTWGTDLQKSSTAFRGSFSVEFLPTGVNVELYQEFNSSSVVAPEALAGYACNLWLAKPSGSISAGVLVIELVDDTGTVTQDAQGVNNSFSVTLSTLTSSFVAHHSVFRLNATPPSVVRLRFRLSTGLVGAPFYLDDAVLAALNGMYAGGPGFVVFSGATPFAGGDGWSITDTNNYGGASNLATFQTGFNRLLNMAGNGLLLPSSGSPSIADTLITTT